MAKTIYIPAKQNTSEREHDEVYDAKRVNVVAGNITLDPGDIQIGAVEIKDTITNDRANVRQDSSGDYRLLVDAGVTSVDANNVVSASTHDTIDSIKASYTVPAGKKLFITFYWASTTQANISVQLQSDGVPLITIPVSPNSFPNSSLSESVPLGAFSSGTVIRFERIEGLSGLPWSAGWVGYLEDN